MRALAVLIGTIALLIGCANAPEQSGPGNTSLNCQTVQAFAANLNRGGPGIILRAQRHGAVCTGASGSLRVGANSPITAGDHFRTASIGKMFTAVAIFRLAERQALDLDADVSVYLPGSINVRLAEWRGPNPPRMTIKHLLSHSGGLPDFTTAEAFQRAIRAEPSRRWTRLDLLDIALSSSRALFAPGAAQSYSDTSYILLGAVIEQTTGQSLAEALRTEVSGPAGLLATFLEGEEPAVSARLAHAYLGDIDVADLHPSYDAYGGGGIASTAEDLASFLDALRDGRLISPSSFDLMQSVPTPTGAGHETAIGHGLLISETALGRCIGHTGFWGAFAFYCPDADLTLVGTVNEADPEKRKLERVFTELAPMLLR